MTDTVPPKKVQIPGFNTLLEGATGVGKTHALRTLPKSGIETFIIFTEPGMEVVQEVSCEEGLHYTYIPPTSQSWKNMADAALKVNQFDFASLTKMTFGGADEHRQFIQVLNACAMPKCQRCGKEFEPLDSWGNDKAFALDSLSGINIMAMNLVVGNKPVKSMSDWGMAQTMIENLIQRLCLNTQCHFVLTAHLERQVDEVFGGVHLVPSTLGKALAPKLARFFSDVIQCTREGDQYYWNNVATNIDLKSRHLPPGAKNSPTFKTLLDNWGKLS